MSDSTSRGPRGFDKARALEQALELFWARGYDGTSISDLTDAIGVSRPSLYAAFGDKEQLFRAAVAHYAGEHAGYVGRALERPTAAEAIGALLADAAGAFASSDRPAGCLFVHGALAAGAEGAVARDLLLAERLRTQAAIRARLARAAEEGDLPPGADPVVIAEYLMTVLNGMAVQALGGADRRALLAVAELASRGLELGVAEQASPKKRGKVASRPTAKQAKPGGAPGQLAMDF